MPFATPKDWGGDPVSQFMDISVRNTFATFQQLHSEYDRIVAVDEEFRRLIARLDGPSEMLAAIFLLRAHASFLGAAKLALAGQVPEAYMLQRGCLEAASYGLFLATHPEHHRTWMSRQESDEARKACRRVFTAGAIAETLKQLDPRSYERYADLYDCTIDFGAHPNVWSIASLLSITETGEKVAFDLAYLSSNTDEIAACNRDCSRSGCVSLDIMYHVFPFGSDDGSDASRRFALRRSL